MTPISYSAPPRTGTVWFCQAAAAAGYALPHNGVHTPQRANPAAYSVTTVRHPYYWLCSYYRALRGGMVGVSVVDTLAPAARQATSLAEFLHTYLAEYPGQVGRINSRYPALFQLPVERMPEAALAFFRVCGVPGHRLAVIRGLPPTNCLKGTPHPKIAGLYAAVMDAEAAYCEHFDYW